ncbi:hypothetical protein GGR02_003573 [Anoxybacillus voinovskiensis]|uniref:Uncharacterized protein n=1 Tax=Anoxybacteroides voinovskiense TaxID=230470 RepID=A0A840E0H2_9BACL|nr:hypothetical protein [Anoxybacillus voinovskiensis]MBB4075718.1 hypothetical protein [Anoxybacillus voinovskiensis]
MRKIYEYLSIEEKKETVKRLKRDLIKLEQEISKNKGCVWQVKNTQYGGEFLHNLASSHYLSILLR